MNIGILTGGGDAPGLNAVIRAVVRKAELEGNYKVIGFRDGWQGVLERDFEELTIERMRGTLPRGGTTLGTSRVTPYNTEDGINIAKDVFAELNIQRLIVVGGEGSLACAHRVQADGIIQVIGVPKTIDNDISATDMTFGFSTAVENAVEAIDKLHTTSESHGAVHVVEVMGRTAGHIAAYAGIAGGASYTLMPESKFDISKVIVSIEANREAGSGATIIVVSEGAEPIEGTLPALEYAVDEFGHRNQTGMAQLVADEIAEQTGLATRVTVLGHIQRGGSPNAFDRVLATRYGLATYDAVVDGRSDIMVALSGTEMVFVELEDVVQGRKLISRAMYKDVKSLEF